MKKKTKKISEPARTSSVERAFRILEEVATSRRTSGLSFTEVKSELRRQEEIPNGTLSNLLRILNQLGYLQFDKEKRLHSLGFRLIELGDAANKRLQGHGRDEECVELLKSVVEKTKSGAHIAVLDSGDALYLLREEAPGFFGARISPGKFQVPHFTAVGKALICCFDEEQVQEILRLHRNPKNTTPNSMTTIDQLMPHLASVEVDGYAIDDEEHERGVRCVAAPIYAGPRRVIASIGISTRAADFTVPKLRRYGAEILRTAADEAANTPRILNALKRYCSISNSHQND